MKGFAELGGRGDVPVDLAYLGGNGRIEPSNRTRFE